MLQFYLIYLLSPVYRSGYWISYHQNYLISCFGINFVNFIKIRQIMKTGHLIHTNYKAYTNMFKMIMYLYLKSLPKICLLLCSLANTIFSSYQAIPLDNIYIYPYMYLQITDFFKILFFSMFFLYTTYWYCISFKLNNTIMIFHMIYIYIYIYIINFY